MTSLFRSIGIWENKTYTIHLVSKCRMTKLRINDYIILHNINEQFNGQFGYLALLDIAENLIWLISLNCPLGVIYVYATNTNSFNWFDRIIWSHDYLIKIEFVTSFYKASIDLKRASQPNWERREGKLKSCVQFTDR